MKVTYKLTLEDYKAALNLHRTQSVGRRIRRIVLREVLPIAALAALVTLIFAPIKSDELHFDLVVLAVALCFLSIALPIAAVVDARICFRRMFPANASDPMMTLDVSDEFVISSIPGISEGKFQWNAFTNILLSDKVALFYIDKRRFLLLPISRLDPEQDIEFRNIVARNGAKRELC
ncbi:MAG TPA: YcxB family protein [Terracidiphilus sp.]|nr:YcxB family protein [Terracidiphilus sp.]